MNKDFVHIDEKLLLRFLLGEANKDEIQQVTEWIQLSEQNQKLLDSFEAIWAEAGKLTPNPVAVDSRSAWERMSERIDKFEKEKTTTKIISLKSSLVWLSSRAAAIIIVV